MGFINTCNNPLNPKLHASYATCIHENQINKTLSTPLLLGWIFWDNNFLDTLLFICSISACLHSKYWGWEKIAGHQTYVPHEL